MPEITEETLQAWTRLADYTDSHGSLDARVALDAAIAEIRRQREVIAAMGEVEARLRGALRELRDEVSAGCHPDAPVEELKDGIHFEVVVKADAALSLTPSAAAEQARAHDERLKAEGAAEALKEAISNSERTGPRDHNELVVSKEYLEALLASVEGGEIYEQAEAERQREEAGR